jgi:hypothetical protein
LYEFHLGAYEDLLELDVAALVAGDGRYQPHLVTGSRFFICSNGKRDRSCAVHGAALYRAMAEKLGSSVWMTTHLGGHRFAPTLLSLPNGFCYGRVHPADVAQFVALSTRGEVWLDKLRGQTAYPAIVQAADYFLRRETGQTAKDAFVLLEYVEDDGRGQVQLRGQDKTVYKVTIATVEPLSVYPNSGSTQLKSVPHYQLTRWQAIPAKTA